jgi:hypothetical protein
LCTPCRYHVARAFACRICLTYLYVRIPCRRLPANVMTRQCPSSSPTHLCQALDLRLNDRNPFLLRTVLGRLQSLHISPLMVIAPSTCAHERAAAAIFRRLPRCISEDFTAQAGRRGCTACRFLDAAPEQDKWWLQRDPAQRTQICNFWDYLEAAGYCLVVHGVRNRMQWGV